MNKETVRKILEELSNFQEGIIKEPKDWGNNSEVEGAIHALEILKVKIESL